jgi:hypothetical protein
MTQIEVLKVVEAGIILILVKAFIEPTAVKVGQFIYRKLDDSLGGKLPDTYRGNQK